MISQTPENLITESERHFLLMGLNFTEKENYIKMMKHNFEL